jgi:hypothetical protein
MGEGREGAASPALSSFSSPSPVWLSLFVRSMEAEGAHAGLVALLSLSHLHPSPLSLSLSLLIEATRHGVR